MIVSNVTDIVQKEIKVYNWNLLSLILNNNIRVKLKDGFRLHTVTKTWLQWMVYLMCQ